MKNTKRSAFTIVELVIVIAVIAILSAVLIPTFGAIIRDANEAADKTAASTLTSELHVYLKGNTIDSEEELMAALAPKDQGGSGIGEKLVPKALSYGHHFWFDMANQMIIAAYPGDVKKMEPAKLKASVNHDGPALMSAELIDETENTPATTYANVGIRDVYDKGYYLITNAGAGSEGLVDALNLIENLKDATDYANLIKYLEKAVALDADNTAATAVLNKVKDTTIRTQFGVFFYDNNSVYEHISGTASYLSGPYYNYNSTSKSVETATAAPVTGKTLKIPANIKMIAEGGLLYTATEGAKASTATVEMPSIDAVVDVFTPRSSNATIVIGGVNHYIPNNNTTTFGETLNKLTDESEWVADLKVRLSFENFYIGYETKKDTTHTDVADLETTETVDKIFVAYRNGKLQLHAVNRANESETSNKVQNWAILDDGKYGSGVVVDSKTGAIDLANANWQSVTVGEAQRSVCQFTVEATTENLNGVEVKDTVTVVVIMPKQATLIIDKSNIAFSGTDITGPDLIFNGASTSYNISTSASYTTDVDGNDPLQLTYELKIEDASGIAYDGSKLFFPLNAEGKPVEEEAYSFNISVDGYYKTKISGAIVDKEKAPIKFNYKKYYISDRPEYVIGTVSESITSAAVVGDRIMLSDIFTISEADMNRLGNAKVTIYVSAQADGALAPGQEIHSVFETYKNDFTNEDGSVISGNPYTLDADYTRTFTKDNWNDAYIRFAGRVTEYYTIYVELAPEDDISTVVRVDIKENTINITNLDSLTPDANGKITLGSNVALHGGFEINTGTTIDVGANTLYGNGNVIDAKEYTAVVLKVTEDVEIVVSEAHTECTVCGNKNVVWTDYACNNAPRYVFGNNVGGHKTNTSLVDYPREVKYVDYRCSAATEIALFDLNGGTIDNIFIDGPVYPELQYGIGDCNLEGHDDHNLQPYNVSGIRTTGDATISNSYVIGFRQPVKVAGNAAIGTIDPTQTNDNGTADTSDDVVYDADINVTEGNEADVTSFINTVLRGGNYANLLIISGNVRLEDVTTIQDFDGMTPTVHYAPANAEEEFTVIGAGIMLDGTTMANPTLFDQAIAIATQYGEVYGQAEFDKWKSENPDAQKRADEDDNKYKERMDAALQSFKNIKREEKTAILLNPLSTNINIEGTFNQHNWVDKFTFKDKELPTIPVYTGKVAMDFILDTIFNGVSLDLPVLGPKDLGRMGRFMAFLHHDKEVKGEANIANRLTDTGADNSAKNELVNLGIILIDMQQSEGDYVYKSSNAQLALKINDNSTNKKPRGFTNLQLSEGVAGISITGAVTGGADCSLVLWSNVDGRYWRSDMNMETLKTISTVVPETTNWDTVKIVTENDKKFTDDLYTTIYGTWYNGTDSE